MAQKRDPILVLIIHATLTKNLPNNPIIRRSLCANSSFGTVRLKLCLNFTPWLRAVFTPPCTTSSANFVYVGKVVFF